jgi:hypothetical protein
MTNQGIVGFSKRVGIIAAAVLAVIALGNTLGGFAMRTLILPKFQIMIAEERESRIAADDALAYSISEMNQDRVRLLLIMEEHRNRERALLLRRFREEIERRKKENDATPQLYGR